MEKNSTNNIIYYLQIEKNNAEFLGNLRDWANLKVAFEEQFIWVKDFTEIQVNATEIRSIPFKTIFYELNNKLFLQHSNLPSRNIPSMMWTPIERAVSVEFPSYNHNFFELKNKVDIRLIPSQNENEGQAIITNIDVLNEYINSAPVIRLQPLSWVILEGSKVLILGKPILPLQGKIFWINRSMLLPTGYDFELPQISYILDEQLTKQNNNWVVWNEDAYYYLVPKDLLKPLSISSFRESIKSLMKNNEL